MSHQYWNRNIGEVIAASASVGEDAGRGLPHSPGNPPRAPPLLVAITAITASADATCVRVSRLATCTNHPLAESRPDPDPNGSLNTTRKSGDDVMIKPLAIARFPRGHAAMMPCPPLRGRTVSLVRTYSTAASPGAPCGPCAPRGPWGPRMTVRRGVAVGVNPRADRGVRVGCGAAAASPSSTTTATAATTTLFIVLPSLTIPATHVVTIRSAALARMTLLLH